MSRVVKKATIEAIRSIAAKAIKRQSAQLTTSQQSALEVGALRTPAAVKE
jgi:hypothetical protein